MSPLVKLLYLLAAVLFIVGLKRLSSAHRLYFISIVRGAVILVIFLTVQRSYSWSGLSPTPVHS